VAQSGAPAREGRGGVVRAVGIVARCFRVPISNISCATLHHVSLFEPQLTPLHECAAAPSGLRRDPSDRCLLMFAPLWARGQPWLQRSTPGGPRAARLDAPPRIPEGGTRGARGRAGLGGPTTILVGSRRRAGWARKGSCSLSLLSFSTLSLVTFLASQTPATRLATLFHSQHFVAPPFLLA